MTAVPRIESVFSKAEIAEMRARFTEEAKARAAQVTTVASRALLARSRTVIDKDRYVLTVVDGDVLDLAKAIEAEATAAAEQRLRALEGALRRLDHIARVFPQSLGEERELDAALDESYRLLHPDSPEKP